MPFLRNMSICIVFITILLLQYLYTIYLNLDVSSCYRYLMNYMHFQYSKTSWTYWEYFLKKKISQSSSSSVVGSRYQQVLSDKLEWRLLWGWIYRNIFAGILCQFVTVNSEKPSNIFFPERWRMVYIIYMIINLYNHII